MRQSVEEKTQTEKFELKLPEQFNRKPDFQVPVSKNYIADIYTMISPEYNRVTGDKTGGNTTSYKIVVRHKDTGKIASSRYSHSWHGTEIDCPLKVKLWLEEAARELAPKVKTRTESVDIDE